jgi:hypothetical protein
MDLRTPRRQLLWRGNLTWCPDSSPSPHSGMPQTLYRRWLHRRTTCCPSTNLPTTKAGRSTTSPISTFREEAPTGTSERQNSCDGGDATVCWCAIRSRHSRSIVCGSLTPVAGHETSPVWLEVWGLSLASGLTELLAEPAEVLGTVREDGVEHVVERLTDSARIAAISAAVASDDVLIADGHHRYAISRVYRDEVRVATGRKDTPAEQTLAFVSELVEDQLSIEAIHRLYTDTTLGDLKAQLGTYFDLTVTEQPDPQTLRAMEAGGFLVLVGPNDAWRLTPRPGAFDGVRPLDGAWLETALANFGASVGYQHGLDEALAEVAKGNAAAAVLIRPVSVSEIQRTAREALLMPPKSTFFTPKLKTGFVVRPLAETAQVEK